ncbi:MAG: TetR/AcrR family transcriptional regulator [Sphaerochaetaceae bacterium]|nr:TetR/AcrR family transcriptional regulator [Sphaerochaetaceae bacterium]
MADRTKLWIAETMKKLMVTKSIEKIRVTDICKAAEIERPTFYYHFRDKYDLMAWTFFHAAYNTNVIDVESSANALDYMKKEFIFFKRVYEDTSQIPMWQYMHEYFVDIYTKLAKELTGKDQLDTQTSYSIRLYCYGAMAMTREWLFDDNLTSSRTVVKMMFESMPETLKNIYKL